MVCVCVCVVQCARYFCECLYTWDDCTRAHTLSDRRKSASATAKAMFVNTPKHRSMPIDDFARRLMRLRPTTMRPFLHEPRGLESSRARRHFTRVRSHSLSVTKPNAITANVNKLHLSKRKSSIQIIPCGWFCPIYIAIYTYI